MNAAELDIIRQEDSKPAEGGSRGGGTVGPTAPRTRVAVSHGAVPWRKLARSRTLFFLCAMYGGVIYGWYFYLTWLPTYLLEARGFALQQAGWLSALPLVGIATGVFAGGWASDFLCQKVGVRVGRRVLGLIGLPLGAWAVVAGVITANAPMSAVYLAMAAGFAALGVAPAWAVCLEIGGRHAGVVTGAMNTFGNIGGALSPIVVGFCVQRLGSWHAPLFSVAALYLFAAVCWLGIDAESRIDA